MGWMDGWMERKKNRKIGRKEVIEERKGGKREEEINYSVGEDS